MRALHDAAHPANVPQEEREQQALAGRHGGTVSESEIEREKAKARARVPARPAATGKRLEPENGIRQLCVAPELRETPRTCNARRRLEPPHEPHGKPHREQDVEVSKKHFPLEGIGPRAVPPPEGRPENSEGNKRDEGGHDLRQPIEHPAEDEVRTPGPPRPVEKRQRNRPI